MRGDKRLRTRAKLIEAAAQVINEKGYDLTTIEEVCRRAGMTRGAFYNNFSNKEELFVAFGETLWPKIAIELKPGAPVEEQMENLGKAIAEATSLRRQVAIAELSFSLHALTREPIRKQIHEKGVENYKWGIKALLAALPAEAWPLPPEQLVRVAHALFEGFTALRSLMPEEITDEIVIAAFRALAGKKGTKR